MLRQSYNVGIGYISLFIDNFKFIGYISLFIGIVAAYADRREGDYWGDLGVDRCIILVWISRRWDGGIWTGLGWPRIETGGGRLSVR